MVEGVRNLLSREFHSRNKMRRSESMSEGAMTRMIHKFCEVNNARFVGWSHGTYDFVDENGTWYYLTQSDLRAFMKKQ
jgi:hypothetical protein